MVQDLYSENNKILLKEDPKEDLNECKDISRSWLGRFKILKTAIVSKVIYRFQAIYKNPS